mmetsp:Transcript_5453/g.16263  ORF Transcript_5453/g.16263 Transcript_5453/m.16263 type:complete len:842 (+) Transcript_5453:114-2639(+)
MKRQFAHWILGACVVTVALAQTELVLKVDEPRVLPLNTTDPTVAENFYVERGKLPVSGGQVLYILSFETEETLDVSISTCLEANFDTAIIQIDGLDAERSIMSYNRFDPTCPGAIKNMARLEVRRRAGEEKLYIVVTGLDDTSGTAQVEFTATAKSTMTLSWGLDRINQRDLPRDQEFDVELGGKGVYVYVVDSGIRRSHTEFEDPQTLEPSVEASRALQGKNFVSGDETDTDDCLGRGTHVAGLIAGRSIGVASKAFLVPVKVLGCDYVISPSTILRAIDWILEDVKLKRKQNNLVVLSVPTPFSQELNDRIKGQLFDQGIPVVAAAGDYSEGTSEDSCGYSPGSLDEVITVSASTSRDTRASFSKHGACTDIYAPGVSINSAFHTGDYAARKLNGTSQAASLVAGAVAVLKGHNSKLPTSEVSKFIVALATKDVLKLNEDGGDANVLVYVRDLPKKPDFDVPPQGFYHIYFSLLHSNMGDECDSSNYTRLEEPLRGWLTDGEIQFESAQAFKCTPPVKPFLPSERPLSRRLLQDQSEDDMTIQYEVLVKSFLTPEVYKSIEHGVENGELPSRLARDTGFEVAGVAHRPWVVDSRGYKFWAAPDLPKQPDSLSTGAIIGIVVGSIAFVIAFVVLALFVVRWIKPAEVEDEIGVAYASTSKIFEDNKSPRFGKKDLFGFGGKKVDVFASQGPEAFAAPINGVSPTIDLYSQVLDSKESEATGDKYDIESLDGGEAAFKGNDLLLLDAQANSFADLLGSDHSDLSDMSGQEYMQGPLRTESFGSEAALFGGGLSRRASFVDADVVQSEPPEGAAASEEVVHVDSPKLRMDSFGEIKLDEDLL